MKDASRISRTILLLAATILTAHFAFANTELWIGNPGVSATTNWSDNANWSTLSGVGSPGYTNNDLLFGNTGAIGTDATINSVLDTSGSSLSMTFTNQSSQFHTIMIPDGIALVNSNLLAVGSAPAIDANSTKVNFTGGGMLVQRGNVTVRNNAVNNGTSLATLDLSGLSSFVCSNSGTLNVGGTGGEQRAAGQLLLAGVSNNITVTTLNLQTTTGNGGNNGGGAHIRLGLGTNIINAGTINFVGGKAVNGTVTFQGATGGLRIRGANGNADDSSRGNITICNRNAGGTGTLTGTADFTGGHVVDIKADTITVGRAGTNPTSGNQNGTGNLRFDAGMIDAVTLNMAINTVTFANTTANVIVGSGGSLVVSNLSLVNQTANTATGNLFIGGTVTCAGSITKTTLAGTGNITITNGTLTLASGGTVGTSAIPIDNLNLSTATLNLSVVNTLAVISVSALNLVDASNTANIAAVPSIVSFPAQFPLLTYTSSLGSGSLNLGTMAIGYSGYVSNDAVNTVWLVVTNGPVAKAESWGGGINNLWDTTTLNWTNAGVAVTYNDNDVVTFDDSAKTNIVNLIATRLPASLTVSNDVLNYTFTGVGSIGGPVTLIKQGNASLTLSETGGDNFSGGVTVSGGTLILDNTNSAISGGLGVALGATAQIGNNNGNGALPAGGVAVDGTLVFSQTNDLTVGGVISGAGSVIKSASGRLTLTATPTYTGNTIVNGGTLALTGAASLSNSAQVAVMGAALDLSGVTGQATLSSVFISNANLSVTMPNATTPVSATTVGMGGAGNTINVSALPPIASYPATVTLIQSANAISGFNATLGTLPAGTPAYAGSVSLSGDQLSVRLTLTAGPVGVRPFVTWSGADAPDLNWTERLNWQLPGAPGLEDNAVFNTTATQPSSAISTPGGGFTALVTANINNIVDDNFVVRSLIYSNASDSYHNTFINAGKSLTVTNVLTLGGFDSGTSAQHGFTTVAGTNASLTVNNAGGNLQVWIGSGSVGGSQFTLDLSALDQFTATLSRLAVGGCTVNNQVNRPSGILYLAKTNSISAGFQTTTIHTGTTTGNAAIILADCNGNAGSQSFLYLGQVNTISADTISIARQKTTATMLFNPLYANVAPYPSVSFQGFSSSQVSIFDVGDGVANTGGTSGTGNLNLNGGLVTATVDTINIGRAAGTGTGSGTTTGNVQFDAGTITVNTLNIGLQPVSGTKVGVGTVSVNTNATMGANATLKVNGDLNLGVNVNSATTAGTLNINGGVVQASNIVAGVNGAASTISLTDGTLIVTNTAGSPAAPLTTLNLTGGRLQLSVDGSAGVPSLVATTITPNGTTIINIGAIANVTTTSTVPLISYTGADPYANLALGTYPAGYAVSLVDNAGASTIDLNIIPPVPPVNPPSIGSITLGGGNIVLSGTNGTEGKDYYVLASTNVALPLTNWTRLSPTNQFGPGGGFSYTNAVDPNLPRRFYLIQVP